MIQRHLLLDDKWYVLSISNNRSVVKTEREVFAAALAKHPFQMRYLGYYMDLIAVQLKWIEGRRMEVQGEVFSSAWS